jgi:hypothetical protein
MTAKPTTTTVPDIDGMDVIFGALFPLSAGPVRMRKATEAEEAAIAAEKAANARRKAFWKKHETAAFVWCMFAMLAAVNVALYAMKADLGAYVVFCSAIVLTTAWVVYAGKASGETKK